MVRNVVASESSLAYFSTYVKKEKCTIGLILGQHTATKDYVVHFAKTPKSTSYIKSSSEFKSLLDISEEWVADHAKHTNRLLPGGMHVLGFFIITKEDPFSDKYLQKTLLICQETNRLLKSNSYLFGNPNIAEKIVFSYHVGSKHYTCKSIDVISGNVKPVDFKFINTPIPWISIECFYELNQIFPIPEKEVDISLKKHILKIIKTIFSNLKSAVFFFDNEKKSVSETLEKSRNSDNEKPIQVSILFPNDCNDIDQALEVRNCGGTINISGQVACKLWVHQKLTVGEINEMIIQDLIRSLASRFEMHWDSLIEEEHGSPEDTNSIHEPPRRIMVKLPGSEVFLSDYLFPGEGPQEARASLEELLDITIKEKDAIQDLEGQVDLSDYYREPLEGESDEALPNLPAETSKFMYLMGLGVATAVLLLSLIIHFFQHIF